MASSRKMLKRWRKQARREGWRIEKTGSGHLKWFAPDGESIGVTSSTPSDPRAIKNDAAELRRAGLDVTP